MKLSKTSSILGLMMTGALALSACGSDNVDTNAGSGSSGAAGSGSSDAASIDCADGSISVSGSSAQATAFTAWSAAYSTACNGATINYNPSGSGAGITDFTSALTLFAGSDSALKDTEQGPADDRCGAGPALNLPMVVSPVAFIYNLAGVDSLTMTPSVLAKIFSGVVTTWDDPAIAEANPDASLPSTSITTIHRSVDSGTTDNFTKFLDAAAPDDWTFGTGKGWMAPGGEGAPDSAGIVSAVTATDGAVSYVDGPDAVKNDLTPALLDTGSGPVEISADSVGAAVAGAERSGTGDDLKLSLNYALQAPDAYPAVLVTYEIVCQSGLDDADAALVKSFLTYTSGAGQDLLSDLGYQPLPDTLLTDVQAAVAALA